MREIADGRIVIESLVDDSGVNRGIQNIQSRLSAAGEKMKGVGEKMTKSLSLPLAAAGGIAIKAAIDFDSSSRKIQSSLGLTSEEAKKMANTAKEVWKDGFGENLDDVTNSLLQVKQNISGIDSEKELQRVTRDAMVLGQTFDADVNEVTRAGNNIMKGFGIDSKQAFDLMAHGAQNGLNFSNEMFDNLSEYAPLFGEMGFSAEEYFQLLEQGAEAGVYNLDYINDAMKEFQIRLKDGSDSTSEAMGQLSKGTQKVWKDYLAGKATVKDVSNTVLAELEGMDDQVKANQIGVSLWGTKWEDLEAEAMYSLGGIDGKLDGVKDSMSEMAEIQEQSLGQRFSAALREAQVALEPLGHALLDVAENVLPVLSEWLGKVGEFLKNLSPEMQTLIVAVGGLLIVIGPFIFVLGMIVQSIGNLVVAFTKVGQAFMWLSKLLMTNPWAIVITFLVIAATLIFKYWDEITAFLASTWEWIKNTAARVWDWIKESIIVPVKQTWNDMKKVWELAKVFLGTLWDGIKTKASEVWNNIKTTISNLVNGTKTVITNVWNGLKTFLSNLWNGIKNVASTVWNGIKTAVMTPVNLIVSAASKAFEGLSSVVKGVWDGIGSAIKGAINFIIGAINGFIRGVNKVKIPDWVPAVGGKGINIPQIPKLATGGNVFGDGSFIAGEAGPELFTKKGSQVKVTPLSSAEKQAGISGAMSNNDRPLYLVVDKYILGKVMRDPIKENIDSRAIRLAQFEG